MEENSNYTYTYKKTAKKQENNRLLFIACGVLAGLLILAVIFGAVAGKSAAKNKYAKEQKKNETSTEVTTVEPVTEEPVTTPYPLGEYKVNTGSNAINFRKSYTTNSDILFEISDGTVLSITEGYGDEQAKAEGREVVYWGQAKYNGSTGWVAMNYLDRVAPAVEQTSEGQSNPGETVTNTPVSSKYQPGDYVVNTDGVGLRFKKSPSADGEVISLIPSGAGVTVLRVVEVEASDEVYRYWGEVRFEGTTGYVSMAYLKQAD